jgi:hypothetical protein
MNKLYDELMSMTGAPFSFAPQSRSLQPTGNAHPITGRPVYTDPDGRPETEKSITVQDRYLNGGKFTNIPTVWGNQQKNDPNWAIINALMSGQQFPAYGSADEAVTAAKERSRVLGNFMPGRQDYWGALMGIK